LDQPSIKGYKKVIYRLPWLNLESIVFHLRIQAIVVNAKIFFLGAPYLFRYLFDYERDRFVGQILKPEWNFDGFTYATFISFLQWRNFEALPIGASTSEN
jgi:hypothetical protein